MSMKKMHIKPVLFTTDKSMWFEKHFDEILDTQRSSEFVIMDDFHVIYVDPVDLKLETKVNDDGKITVDFDWFQNQFTEKAVAMGYNYVGFHMSKRWRTYWKIDDSLGGAYTKDKDKVYEFWLAANRNEKAPDYASSQYYEFVRLMLHEGGHGFTHFAGRNDLVEKFELDKLSDRNSLPAHYFDYVEKDIKLLFYHVSFRKWSTKLYLVSVIKHLIGLLTLEIEKRQKEAEKDPERDYMNDWALAIQQFEGYLNPKQYPPDGTLAYRQNNPGNLRWSPFEDGSANGFAVFDTYEKGFNALLHQLRIAATGESRVYTPDMTLQRFFEVYAPSSDNNYPEKYAAFVAKQLGLPVGTRISQLI